MVKFFCIEGVDGVGKGTLAKKLLNYLVEKFGKNKVFLFHEPFDLTEESFTCKKNFYHIVKNNYGSDAISEIFLLNACRSMMFDYIDSNCPKDSIVILDRFFPSTLVYQGKNINRDFLYNLCWFASRGTIPVATCFLDASYIKDIVFDRIKKRNADNDLFVDDFNFVVDRYVDVFNYLIEVKEWNVFKTDNTEDGFKFFLSYF